MGPTVDERREIPRLLGELTFLQVGGLRVLEQDLVNPQKQPDFEVSAGPFMFLIEYKARSNAEAVGSALQQIRSWRPPTQDRALVTLLVVPYMGAVGRRLCEADGVNWMDLSGNAFMRAPGLNVNVRGRPNRYARPGRPQDVFAPKAARLARVFLTYPDQGWHNHSLVEATQLSKGYVSKVVARLEHAGFIEKRDDKCYWPRSPGGILDAWRESYDFSRHRTLKGYVAERTPEEVLYRLVEGLGALSVKVAITGLAAAWHYNHHAAFRLCSLYVSPFPEMDQLSRLGFRPVKSGENSWLIEPIDESVFDGVLFAGELPYVSPLQAYLDLKDHPERAEEAADMLRPLVLHEVPE